MLHKPYYSVRSAGHTPVIKKQTVSSPRITTNIAKTLQSTRLESPQKSEKSMPEVKKTPSVVKNDSLQETASTSKVAGSEVTSPRVAQSSHSKAEEAQNQANMSKF